MKFSRKENFQILSNAPLTVWGGISHLNGFEILILFYILYDRISEVSDWN